MNTLSHSTSGQLSKNDSFDRLLQFLQKTISNNRFPHAILFHGPNLNALESLAYTLAAELLKSTTKTAVHPDCFALRPTNKMRQISAEDTRELISNIQKTPSLANGKVAIIYEADRMHLAAANAFLKTLEEPPLNTYIFLLTNHPYRLLETIRSRCMALYLPTRPEPLEHPLWLNWTYDYQNWLSLASSTKSHPVLLITSLYTLIATFESLLKNLSDTHWELAQNSLPFSLTEEETLALKTSFQKSLRDQLFTNIAHVTRNFVFNNPEPALVTKLTLLIEKFEHLTSLLDVNLNECALLESFLLYSLRIWNKPPVISSIATT